MKTVPKLMCLMDFLTRISQFLLVAVVVSSLMVNLGYGQPTDTIRCVERTYLKFNVARLRVNIQNPFEMNFATNRTSSTSIKGKLGFKGSVTLELENAAVAHAFGAEIGIRQQWFSVPDLSTFSVGSIFVAPYWRLVVGGEACDKRSFFIQTGIGMEYKIHAESKWFSKYDSFHAIAPYFNFGPGIFLRTRKHPSDPINGHNWYFSVLANFYLQPYFLLPVARNSNPFWISINYTRYLTKWKK